MTIDNDAWRDALPSLQSLVDRAAPEVWRRAGRGGNAEASVVMSSDSQMRKLNHKHRDVDHPTNVLAFPLGEPMWPDGPDPVSYTHLTLPTILLV